MPASLAQLHCPNPRITHLRDSLLPLYQRLADMVAGQRSFGGFLAADELQGYQMSADVYPALNLHFTTDELAQLLPLATQDAAGLLAQVRTPLERLLLAALWKNGDLAKIRHIAEGLGYGLGQPVSLQKKTAGPVFKQFGQHLAAPALQPIADQHTLRAYRLLREDCAHDAAHLKATSCGAEIAQYVAWVRTLAGGHSTRAQLYAFDQSMFALGKATKEVLAACRSTSLRTAGKATEHHAA